MTTLSQDEPLTQLPAPTLSGPLPTRNPAPVAPADQSPEEAKRAQALQQAVSAERKQFGMGTNGRDHAAALLPHRPASAPPTPSGAPRAPARQVAAGAPAPRSA